MEASRRAEILEKVAFWGAAGKVTAKPFQMGGSLLSDIFMGAKATKTGGGFEAGSRLRSGGMKNINVDEYHSLLEKKRQADKASRATGYSKGPVSGVPEVRSVNTPSGSTNYQKEVFRPGGLAGFAIKHPLITTGAVGAGTLLAKRPRPIVNNNNNTYVQQPQASGQDTVNWG